MISRWNYFGDVFAAESDFQFAVANSVLQTDQAYGREPVAADSGFEFLDVVVCLEVLRL